MKYRFAEKKKVLAFGVYPEVSLAEARNERDKARKLLRSDNDPAQVRKENKRFIVERQAQTFEKLARERHTNKLPTWHASTARDTMRRLEIDIFPQFGEMPIGDIRYQHVISQPFARSKRVEQRRSRTG